MNQMPFKKVEKALLDIHKAGIKLSPTQKDIVNRGKLFYETLSENTTDKCPYCNSGREEWDYFTNLQGKQGKDYEKVTRLFSNKYFKEFTIRELPISMLDEDIQQIIYKNEQSQKRSPNTAVYKGHINEKWFEYNDPEWLKLDKGRQEQYLSEKINKNEFLKEMKKFRETDVPVKLALPRFDPKQQRHDQSLNILGLIDLARLTIWKRSIEYDQNTGKTKEKAIAELKQKYPQHPLDFFREFKSGEKYYVSSIPFWYAVLFNFLLNYRNKTRGLPDFIVYNVANDFFYFVECKANTGILSEEQLEVKSWIERYYFPYLSQHREVKLTLELGESRFLNNEGVLNQTYQNKIDQLEKENNKLKSPDAIAKRDELIKLYEKRQAKFKPKEISREE